MGLFLSRRAITRVQSIVVLVIVILAAVGSYWFLTSGPTAPARDYYKIGVLTELTGSLSRGGYITKRGYDIWADVINEQGGIMVAGKQYKVQLVYYDAKSDPAFGAEAADKMISEGIDFALGPYSSAVTLGSAPIFEKNRVPMVTGSAESNLIKQQHFNWTFQSLVTADLTPVAPTELVLSKLHVTTVAITGTDDAYGKSLAESFRTQAQAAGLQVVFYEIYPLDLADMSSIISRIKALSPDVYINAGHPPNHVVAVKNSVELGFNPKIFLMHWGVDTADYLDPLGALSNNTVGVTMWLPTAKYTDPVFGNSTNFADEFETRYGITPDYTSAGCAGTGVFVQQVLEQSGITPPFDDAKRAQFKAALEQLTATNLMGPWKFSTDPASWHVNMALAANLVVIQIRNGNPVPIAPDSVKEMDVVFPKPAWSSS